MKYKLIEATPDSKAGVELRGAAAAFWRCKNHELILAGPAETGKTYGALQKLNALCWKYPGAQAVIVRKTYKSTVSSVVQSYRNKVLGKGSPVVAYGGEKPEWFDYPNGSRVWVGGMDNPDKVLSSERDFIYVNQAEELSVADWETLATRSTGRAGNAPYSQLMGDCNPSTPTHWIKQRAAVGALTLLASKHQDNPMLYTADGQITEQGQRTMAILNGLTGLRHKRLCLGLWVQAEGVIYEDWDEQTHVIDAFEIPASWRRFRVVDFGYTNPFVCLWFAVDHDGRLYCYRQMYHTRRTVKVHAEKINQLSAGEKIEATICDHDAEDRATLEENGIKTQPAEKSVSVGIQKVQERLKLQADGKPRLFFYVIASLKLIHPWRSSSAQYQPSMNFPVMCGATNRRKKNRSSRTITDWMQPGTVSSTLKPVQPHGKVSPTWAALPITARVGRKEFDNGLS